MAAQVARRLAFYPFLVGTLLSFPAALPSVLVGWLALFGLRLARGKPGWPTLLTAVALVLIKRVDWPPSLVVLGLLMLAAAGLDHYRREKAALRVAALVAAAALVPAWLVMAWQWGGVGHTSRRPALQPDRPIVCLGDSLTVRGFPRVLEKRLRVPVIDRAQGGITAAEGLRLLPDILALKPQAIVVELGGHDSLRGKSRAETKATLEQIVRDGREAGAEVFLFEIPRGFVVDPYAGLERELARHLDLELIHDGAIRQLVLFSPFTPLGRTGRVLSDDGLHPNDAGHAFLADRVEAALTRVYGASLQR